MRSYLCDDQRRATITTLWWNIYIKRRVYSIIRNTIRSPCHANNVYDAVLCAMCVCVCVCVLNLRAVVHVCVRTEYSTFFTCKCECEHPRVRALASYSQDTLQRPAKTNQSQSNIIRLKVGRFCKIIVANISRALSFTYDLIPQCPYRCSQCVEKGEIRERAF